MSQTLAQINATTIPTYFPFARTYGTIGSLVNVIVPVLVFGSALIFLAMLFFAAYEVLSAAGSAEKIESARNTATYAVIGLVLIMLATLIVKIIGYVLNVPVPL